MKIQNRGRLDMPIKSYRENTISLTICKLTVSGLAELFSDKHYSQKK